MASLALGTGAWPHLSEGGVAEVEGGVVAMCERVAPVRMALAEARSGVTVAGHRMAVMAHLASGPVVAPPAADARL